MPERIQLRRTMGWRKPEGAIMVARPTKWGNPFAQVVPPGYRRSLLCHLPTMTPILAMGCFEVATQDPIMRRKNATEAYRAWIEGPTEEAAAIRAAAPLELRGHDLCCWCPLDQPCHADVLLELANRENP